MDLIENSILVGESCYAHAIDLMIGSAQKELLIFDDDLSKGGYTTIKRFEQFQAFLAKPEPISLQILLKRIDHFSDTFPRLFDLYKRYTHNMAIYEVSDHAQDMFIIVDGKHYLRRFHVDHARFRFAHHDSETVANLKMRYDELMLAVSTKLSPTVLGI